jgi:hypothetical protein
MIGYDKQTSSSFSRLPVSIFRLKSYILPGLILTIYIYIYIYKTRFQQNYSNIAIKKIKNLN